MSWIIYGILTQIIVRFVTISTMIILNRYINIKKTIVIKIKNSFLSHMNLSKWIHGAIWFFYKFFLVLIPFHYSYNK